MTFRCNWRTYSCIFFSGLTMLLSLPGVARSQDTLGSHVNGLTVVDFAGDYITPRGVHVEDEGLINQPLLLLFWKLHASDRGPVSEVTLTTGVWNSFHSHPAGFKSGRWNEIDPIFGLTVKLRNKLTVDASTTAFYTPTDSYATSGHADIKLTYSDSLRPAFSINPYFDYWMELNDKATVVFDPLTSSRGSYATIGATPTLALSAKGATLDVGTYANFVTSDFYQRFDGSNGGSGLAIVSVAPKINLPLKFLGVGFGAWTGYAGVSYYHLRNAGLLDGNEALDGSPERKPNLTRIHAGLSTFF